MLGANASSAHPRLTTVSRVGARIVQAACVIVLLVLIAGLCAALIPRPFGFRPTVVSSGSMGHSIPIGSLAMTHPVGAAAIHEGDVILVHQETDGVDARPKLHRVVALEHDGDKILVSTKGDANADPDPNLYVLPARVDVVAYSMPYLGFLVAFILTPAGWMLAVGVPGLLVCGFMLRKIWAADDSTGSAEIAAQRLLRLNASAPIQELGDMSPERDRPEIVRLPMTRTRRLPRPSLLSVAVALVAISALTVAAVGYVMAPRPADNDDNGRLAREAVSLTDHSARLATRDGYAADLLVLRNADDPAILAPGRPEREAALSRLLAGASNMFDALAVIDPAGHVIATTDPAIVDVHASAAFLLARANGGAASSADTSTPGAPRRVDYAAPARAEDGSLAGVLLARAAVERLWAPTLETTVDGSRNVIIDANGLLIAGASPDALGRAWDATPAGFDGLRTSLDGTPSTCGQSAIGQGTHLDLGWRVASCLPDSLATAGSTPSLQRYGASVAGAAVAVMLLASIVLYAVARAEQSRAARREAPAAIESIEARPYAREA